MHVTKFFQSCDAFLASGSREKGKIEVSSFAALVPPHKSVVDHYPAISGADLTRAAQIGARLRTFFGPWQEHHWRLSRCREIYQTARYDRDVLNRIDQFTRCIEGLIVPEQGKTRRQFMSRTELFVGQGHRDLMGELYDVRSHFEHLHEYRYLAQFDRTTRIRLAGLEAISEGIARDCLARILLDPALMTHFGGLEALNAFWVKPEADRRAVWGKPLDPMAPLHGFDFNHVSNEELGARA